MHPALPEMSRQEASWHEHLSGMRAGEAARNQGGDPAATAAIASATAGPRRIGNYNLAPATQGTVWTLQRMAREFATWAETHGLKASENAWEIGRLEMLELGLASLVFCDARACWREMDAGNWDDLISRAETLIWETPYEVQQSLQNHFTKEMQMVASLGHVEDEPKKSPPPVSGAYPAPQIPQAAQA